MRLIRPLIFLLTCGLALWADADSVWIGESATNPIRADGVKIVKLDGAQIVFQTPTGVETTKAAGQIQQIAVDDEPAFNAAEEAYRAGKLPAAVDGYLTALHSSKRDWLQLRAALRLSGAAAKLQRFDAQVSAFIFLARQSPAAAVAPKMADANPGTLDAATTEITQTLEGSGLTDAQRGMILQVALNVYRAKGDAAHVNSTLQQLVKLGVATDGDRASLALVDAAAALSSRDFTGAAAKIQGDQGLFSDAAQEVEALYILAQARDGLCARSDKNAVKDVAIAYMRVVAVGKEVAGQPRVAEALLRTGQLEEELAEPAVAKELYLQVLKEYPTQGAAGGAKAGLDRLGKGA